MLESKRIILIYFNTVRKEVSSGDATAASAQGTRGSYRGGGRVLPDQVKILKTKPEAVTSKKGIFS